MMLALKVVAAVVVLIGAYVLIAGSAVKRRHVASVRATLARPPAEVWQAVTDHAAQPSWRKDLKSLDLLPARDGKDVRPDVRGKG